MRRKGRRQNRASSSNESDQEEARDSGIPYEYMGKKQVCLRADSSLWEVGIGLLHSDSGVSDGATQNKRRGNWERAHEKSAVAEIQWGWTTEAGGILCWRETRTWEGGETSYLTDKRIDRVISKQSQRNPLPILLLWNEALLQTMWLQSLGVGWCWAIRGVGGEPRPNYFYGEPLLSGMIRDSPPLIVTWK